jgi:hypothetical protein
MQIRPPKRVTRSYTQSINGPPADVFPLLCPVRETEWVHGWNPSLVLSNSGVVEQDCVFTTPGMPEDALWVVTGFNPDEYLLEIVKLIPKVVVGKIRVRLEPAGDGQTSAEISYSYTSLGDYGDSVLEEFTEEHFRAFMQSWEWELNNYLETGERLPGPDSSD